MLDGKGPPPIVNTDMIKLTRREFATGLLGSIATSALVSSLVDAQSLTGSVKPIAHKWLFEMQEICKDERGSKIKVTQWQDQIETLLNRVDLADLLKAIDYDRLAKSTTLYSNHETAEDITFSRIKGLPEELAFAPYFYGMKKGAAIVPHGHQNMTTMHMMLKGEARGRHFDRVSDEPGHLIIKPTKDKTLSVGDVSTISSERDNIHWFRALSEPVFMFNIGVYGLDPKAETTGRDYIDPVRGERLADGTIRVTRIDSKSAYKIYGGS